MTTVPMSIHDAKNSGGPPIDTPVARRILIVDDDRDFADSLVDLLANKGYQILVVYDVGQVDDAIKGFDVNVAILDIRLGQSTGLSLISHLREKVPQILCIMMTAYAEIDTAIEAIKEGAYDYIRKPPNPHDIFKTLDRCFEKIELSREKMLAEEALKESEQRYRRVVEDQTELIFRWLPNGKRTFINESYCHYFGKTQEELLQSDFYPLIHEDDREQFRQRIASISRTNPVSFSEHRVILPDGSIAWNQWSDRAIFDGNDCIIEFQSVGRDITALRQANDRLRAILEGTSSTVGDDFFQSLVRHLAQTLNVKYSYLTEIIDANKTKVRTVVFWEGEKIGKDFEYELAETPCEFVIGGEIAYYPQNVTTYFPNDPILSELGCAGYLGIPICDSKKNILGHLVIMSDVELRDDTVYLPLLTIFGTRAGIEMERKRTVNALEQAHQELEDRVAQRTADLQRSEEKYRNLVEGLKDEYAFFTLNSDLIITYASPSIENVLGYEPDDLIGRHASELTTPEEFSKVVKPNYDRAMSDSSEPPRKYQSLKYNDSGDLIEVECYERGNFNEDGKCTGIEGIGRDITKQREAQKELQIAKETADSASRAKSEFLANMSHELRTPLNGILGYAQILKRDDNLTEKQLEGLNVIQHSGEHLLLLINDILDLSKIEAKKFEVQHVRINFIDFLKSSVEIPQMSAEEKGVNFLLDIDANLPEFVMVDDKRLHQILSNLLSNAVKFTEKGNVAFRIQCIEQIGRKPGIEGKSKKAKTSAIANYRNNTEKVYFEIRDTGIGIPKDRMKKIFQPFHQVRDYRKNLEGTGLGLAISKELIHLMGSTLHVESVLGKHSIFSFELQLQKAFESHYKSSRDHGGTIIGYKGRRRTVLVADDNKDNLSVLVQLLEPIGFRLMQAENGETCCDLAVKFKPDLIIMDIIMPVMDGLEATRTIRSSTRVNETPIIVLSARVFEEDRAKSHKAGCNEFLPKPVNEMELFEAIKNCLNLEWILQEKADLNHKPVHKKKKDTRKLCMPPDKDLKVLIEFSRIGDIQALRKKLAKLKGQDKRFLPFVINIQSYADKYDMEKIEKFLQHPDIPK